VGKSTIFNAITATQNAQAANYPFCTIEPNVGVVAVPDQRLDALAKIAQPQKVIPTMIEFVDIAGLVRGASKGEGLGNQFLSHIREVDAIAHVIRCFEDDDIVHVEGKPDPARDAAVIDIELALRDLESVRTRRDRMARTAQTGDRVAKAEVVLLDRIIQTLDAGKPLRGETFWRDDESGPRIVLTELSLLTAKPVLYVANVAEKDLPGGDARFVDAVRAVAKNENAEVVVISGKLEAEVSQLPDAERPEFLASAGLEECGLAALIRAGYRVLDLRTFFTAGPKEVRAWTIPAGATAPKAAGVIHSDFERGFIRAETISFADYVACGGEAGSKEKGKMRIEGKSYVVQDGDVFYFRFSV
jgi:GTP-binding protein YchF